jgi:hypothetical protein
MHGANYKQLIVRQCQLPITDITHLVSLDIFDDEACNKVDAPLGYQGLYLQASAKAGRDRIVYYQEFFVGKTKRLLKFPETSVTFF